MRHSRGVAGGSRHGVAAVLMAAAVAVLLVGTGCAGRQAMAPQSIEGETFGVTSAAFRNRWWHFYERGLSWARGGFLTEAEADLRQCLALRQSDARRARTYGMHFVHCFAHRELGAVLLAQGRHDEAERELRTSMEQEPSAKAEHLLRRIAVLRGEVVALPADAAVAVLPAAGAAAAAAPGAGTAPDQPGFAASRSRLLVEAVAPGAAAGMLAVRGQVLGAGDGGLWCVDPTGQRRRIALGADGRFAAELAQGSTLAVGGGSEWYASASRPPTALPELHLDGPGDGRPAQNPLVWYRYDAEGAQGLARLLVEDEQGVQLASVDLSGVRAAGLLGVDLAPGSHRLRFRLEDRSGASDSDHRQVVVRPAPAVDRRLRAAAMLIPLQAPQPSAMGPGDDPQLLAALLHDGRFRLVDSRADRLLAAELALVEAGHVDRTTAARAGRRLACRYVLAGTFARGGDGVECFVRLIRCDSGQVLATADAYAARTAGGVEHELFAALAGRLRQAFPVVEAAAQAEGGSLALDAGSASGVVPGMRFHLLAGSAEAAGDQPTIIATAEVTDLEPRRSALRLVDGRPLPAALAVSE